MITCSRCRRERSRKKIVENEVESHDNRRVTLLVSKEARQPHTPYLSFPYLFPLGLQPTYYLVSLYYHLISSFFLPSRKLFLSFLIPSYPTCLANTHDKSINHIPLPSISCTRLTYSGSALSSSYLPQVP